MHDSSLQKKNEPKADKRMKEIARKFSVHGVGVNEMGIHFGLSSSQDHVKSGIGFERRSKVSFLTQVFGLVSGGIPV